MPLRIHRGKMEPCTSYGAREILAGPEYPPQRAFHETKFLSLI